MSSSAPDSMADSSFVSESCPSWRIVSSTAREKALAGM